MSEKDRSLIDVADYAAGSQRAVQFILINTRGRSPKDVAEDVAVLTSKGVRWSAEVTGIASVIAVAVNPSTSTTTADHLADLQGDISAIPGVSGQITLQVVGGEAYANTTYTRSGPTGFAWRAHNGWP